MLTLITNHPFMKYVITGAAGNISGLLAKQLLKAGHEVRVTGRNRDHLKELIACGADTAIGSMEDVAFLNTAFSGADAVYTMFPPNFSTIDYNGFCEKLARNYVESIQSNGISYVVNLSGVGAHLPEGTGPVAGMYLAEEILGALTDVNIKHLRPVYLYQNLLGCIDMIRGANAMGNNFNVPTGQFPMSAPADIADAAAAELMALDFAGHSVRYIASDETGTDEVAAVIGKAIGKPDLQWRQLSDEQVLESLLQQHVPKEIAGGYVELGRAINSGLLLEDYWMNRPSRLGNVKLEDFAGIFAEAFK